MSEVLKMPFDIYERKVQELHNKISTAKPEDALVLAAKNYSKRDYELLQRTFGEYEFVEARNYSEVPNDVYTRVLKCIELINKKPLL